MGFWPRVDHAVSRHRAVIVFPLQWHGSFWMEDVEPRGNASFPQLYLVPGILLPEVAPFCIRGRNRLTGSHSPVDGCSVSSLAQGSVPVHSLCPMGVFCNGLKWVYLVSQLMEREIPLRPHLWLR